MGFLPSLCQQTTVSNYPNIFGTRSFHNRSTIRAVCHRRLFPLLLLLSGLRVEAGNACIKTLFNAIDTSTSLQFNRVQFHVNCEIKENVATSDSHVAPSDTSDTFPSCWFSLLALSCPVRPLPPLAGFDNQSPLNSLRVYSVLKC